MTLFWLQTLIIPQKKSFRDEEDRCWQCIFSRKKYGWTQWWACSVQTILLNLPNKLIIITHFCLRTIEHNEKWSTCQPNSRHKRIFHASSRTDTWGDIKNTTPSNKRTEGSKPQQDFWTSANGSKLVRLKCHILWFIVQIDGINKVHQIDCFWVILHKKWHVRVFSFSLTV